MTLREVLHAHIPTLRPASTFRDAVDKMDIYQFPALVVTNDDLKPLAVVTEGDLCRAAQQHDSVTKLGEQPVLTFSSIDPVLSSLDTEVSDALHLMLSKGLTVLPVVEDDRLAGMVLRVDLMQAMLMDAAQQQQPSGA